MAGSETKQGESEAAAGGPPAGGRGRAALLGVAILGLGLGVATGALALGPRLAPPAGAAGDSIPAAAADGERQGEPGARLVMLDNIIVNPAGSRGTRFLMASVALEVADEELQRRLAEQDVQLRDAVTSLLERQTMESLTLPGARDSLKRHIAAAVAPFVGDRRLRVYLPQFVIQ